MANTRVLFASDVHGSEVCFIKFLNGAKYYRANVLILAGDITGKMIVPIVERQDGTAVANLFGTPQTLKNKQERLVLEQNIRNSGYYPYPTTQVEFERLQADKKLVDELFSKVMADSVKRWVLRRNDSKMRT